MRRIQRDHQESGGNISPRTITGHQSLNLQRLPKRMPVLLAGALLKDTELPAGTREAHQSSIALRGVYVQILHLHRVFGIQVLLYRAEAAS